MSTAIARPAPTPAPAPAAAVAQRRLEQLRARPRRPGEASFFYHDAFFGNAAVKVLPGEFFVHDDDVLIMTTLGSCIAACLWDRERRIGGMNHFMLPDVGSGGDASGRYGSYAMELLINELVKRGATRATMEAKVFGGGAVISGMTSLNVGERNTQFVLDYLKTERIAVVSKDVMDVYPRKVCFLPASGKAMVKRLAPASADAVVREERLAAQRVVPPASGAGSVDLF
ncbi:chemoreceptor glutamine deamidase CheD [Azohydromonas sediminis]|uniref:chemoreceptor glutamine deamidase CheD n=1 Tax=Azohydromonas sediminis TaxID=2259674 RepID=UPI000E655D47|nr:chemoreceptor glutamine deamidase CheD [Azohydromonas sediminis]